MSDNKIYDTLEFDDDIDFNGLDEEIEEEIFETLQKNEFDDDSSVKIDEYEKEENVDTSIFSEPSVLEDFVPNEELEEEKELDISEEASIPSPVNISVYDDKAEEEFCAVKKSQRTIKKLGILNIVFSSITLCVFAVGTYLGYRYISSIKAELETKSAEVEELEGKNNALEAEYLEAMNTFEKESEEKISLPDNETEQGKIIYYDSSVGYSWLPVLTGIKQNTYKKEGFSVDERYRMTYTENGEESSYFGIDVSSYQGDIDWQLVKEDGVEFAFLRIGYRGYGAEGKLCPDEFFIQNYEAARDAGIDLGVYFFSQAATVDDAVEEAEYVLTLLENRTLEYPIVFDWENIYTGDPEDIPRTDDVMPQTLTLSAIAFCETVKDAGYDAMIYTNKKLATIKYDLRQLKDYPIWLAYYDTEFNYCYDFDIWQYGTAQVDGIEGEVDVNIAIIK